MTTETELIHRYINKSGYYLEKINQLKTKCDTNLSLFKNLFGYVVMEIVNENKDFLYFKRLNLEVDDLAKIYWDGKGEV